MKGTLALIVIIFIIVIGLNMYKSAKISKVLANMGEPVSLVTAMKITLKCGHGDRIHRVCLP